MSHSDYIKNFMKINRIEHQNDQQVEIDQFRSESISICGTNQKERKYVLVFSSFYSIEIINMKKKRYLIKY
jgi:uncharacterized protein YcbK (DUF882 family)